MKKFLIALFVIILVAGGAAAYWFLVREADEAPVANTDSQTTPDGANQFAPMSTQNVPMIATITTTQDGKKTTIVMKFDGKGSSEYTSEQNGEEVQFIATKDAYYMCNTQGCYKYANTQQQAGATNPDQYDYSQSDIDAFRANATNKGKQSCGSGTCDVWEVANFAAGGKGTFYVDTNSKRIVKVESTFNGSTSTIEYEYTDVTITIPTNAQELPSGI